MPKIGSGSQVEFKHGSNLDVDTIAEQLTTTSIQAADGVLIKASVDNTAYVYVGTQGVTAATNQATDGMELAAGESYTIPVDNVNKVWVIAAAENQKLFWSSA